jgi:phosphoglycolate phosphatase-like HAD superfamily hydrolase
MTEKPKTDWERIELDYRAGLLSVREIADARGVSHTAINKKAKALGWDRDLSARIKAKADALVSKAEVSKEVSAERLATERQIIDAGAEAILRVKLGHRTRITRHSELLDKLQLELEEADGDLASRVDISKKLADTLKTLITLERDAFDIVTATKVDVTTTDATPRTLDDFYGSNS